jgi:hypothetical protein
VRIAKLVKSSKEKESKDRKCLLIVIVIINWVLMSLFLNWCEVQNLWFGYL